MERPFIHVALQGSGKGSVAMEVAVPLTEFSVEEVIFDVLMHRIELGKVGILACHAVSHEVGNRRLTLRPPELHVVPVLCSTSAQGIAEVDDSSHLAVPTLGPHPIEHRGSQAHQFRIIVAVARLIEDEPCTLNGVAGVELASLEVVELQRTVRIALFHHYLQLRTDEVRLDLLKIAVDASVESCSLVRKCGPEFLYGIEQDHGEPESQGSGLELGNQDAGSG